MVLVKIRSHQIAFVFLFHCAVNYRLRIFEKMNHKRRREKSVTPLEPVRTESNFEESNQTAQPQVSAFFNQIC